MKKMIYVLLAALLLVVFCFSAMAETAATSPMFTVNVTQLVIAIIGVVFSALLTWILAPAEYLPLCPAGCGGRAAAGGRGADGRCAQRARPGEVSAAPHPRPTGGPVKARRP